MLLLLLPFYHITNNYNNNNNESNINNNIEHNLYSFYWLYRQPAEYQFVPLTLRIQLIYCEVGH